MTVGKDQYRTYAYRRFKGELTHLSRLHWVFRYGVGFVRQSASTAELSDDDRLMTALPVTGFEAQRLNVSVGEFCAAIDNHVDHLRLLLLVKACANMEDYLHRIAQIWLVANGYFDAEGKMFLDKRGKALIAPALVSNLESSLSYLAVLLSVNFGSNAGVCGKAYKLRCLAAHNGGVVDYEAIKVFTSLKSELGRPIRLSWPDLHCYLRAITGACNAIERAIPMRDRIRSEACILVGEVFGTDSSVLHTEATVRQLLKDRFEFNRLPSRKYLSDVVKAFS
jgi:hypothetical protein